ncbi:MAG: hypothetical protein LM550_14210 [Candidatus Contendobacter sp.]|jgi:hypothetical protein|nr:hypothetical protein [Gammaproteobacteria bacterium]MCC8994807.1 hypothetical protein [Candidatus Contendobacter sp.]
MGILQTLEDMLFGGKPTRWTQQQWDVFCENYAKMEKEVFSWGDFKPPTSLPALAATLITLSLKSLIKGGNRARFAQHVDKLNLYYLDGGNTRDRYEDYWTQYTALGYNNDQVFIITLALHDRVFPGARRDN